MSVNDEICSNLRCPKCLFKVAKKDDFYFCLNTGCGSIYPIIEGIPIFINEEKSLFRVESYTAINFSEAKSTKKRIRKILFKLIPGISKNIKAKQNFKNYLNHLYSKSSKPKVLVIGGSTIGQGSNVLLTEVNIELIESDVVFGPRTQIILDAHNIPFANETFDGVVCQAVLEHVIDPYICVQEIHRVLKSNGTVYAETPFMQQVHMGAYDFNRFTHLGHRRLFRNFYEIESGAVCGPGMALAWAYSYFILSFTASSKAKKILIPFVHFTSFFLKYFDYYLINKPSALDAASGFYFMGEKSCETLKDRDLLKLYRGKTFTI